VITYPIPLRIVDPPPVHEHRQPGMMFRYPLGDIPNRECWWVVLPNTKPQGPGYCDEVAWRTTDRESDPPHELWSVTGTPPAITVSPSIDVECWMQREGQKEPVHEGSYWHGHIQAGMITP
jgi:hypothetical protein